MKILVANNVAPFVRGGAELLADRLILELRKAVHEAELLRLPLGRTPEQMLDAITAAALLDVVNVDRVIGLKFPAYLIPHPNTVIWLVHQLRQVYDPPPVGWGPGTGFSPVATAARRADQAAFTQARRLYAISPMVADRVRRTNGVDATVLMTPPHADQQFRTAPPEDFVVALGRLSAGKRQLLAVQAMRHARPGYRLVVAGAPDSPEALAQIEREIETPGGRSPSCTTSIPGSSPRRTPRASPGRWMTWCCTPRWPGRWASAPSSAPWASTGSGTA